MHPVVQPFPQLFPQPVQTVPQELEHSALQAVVHPPQVSPHPEHPVQALPHPVVQSILQSPPQPAWHDWVHPLQAEEQPLQPPQPPQLELQLVVHPVVHVTAHPASHPVLHWLPHAVAQPPHPLQDDEHPEHPEHPEHSARHPLVHP